MKKYKIGNRIVEAKSVMEAIKINKIVDSCKVSDAYLIQLKEDADMFLQENDNWGRNKKYAKRFNSYDEAKRKANAVVSGWPYVVNIITDSCYKNDCKDEASEDTTISALIADEHAAIDAYRVAIENLKGRVSDKAIAVLEHILEEEEEHVKELQSIEEDDEEEVDITDDRLSPMTYKKLKELGVSSEQWKNWTQEEANDYIKNREQKSSKHSKETSSQNSTLKIEQSSRVANTLYMSIDEGDDLDDVEYAVESAYEDGDISKEDYEDLMQEINARRESEETSEETSTKEIKEKEEQSKDISKELLQPVKYINASIKNEVMKHIKEEAIELSKDADYSSMFGINNIVENAIWNRLKEKGLFGKKFPSNLYNIIRDVIYKDKDVLSAYDY